MGRVKKPIYVYKDGQFLIKCESTCSTARLTKESIGNINDILKKPRWSRHGYFYSDKELREDELPDFVEPKIKVIPRQFESYADEDEDGEFYITKSKRKAKENLRQFINVHMQQHWREVPTCVAQMERRYISALLAQL